MHHKLRFIGFISASVAVSLVLVAISIAMYFSSGTAQLDLSRPGYQSVRSQAKPEDPYKGFDASGPVDENSLQEFDSKYKDRAKNALSVDAFNSDALSDASLNIDDVPDTTQ